jgi:type IV secretory pathway TraG/TraD family ATPase VirD4
MIDNARVTVLEGQALNMSVPPTAKSSQSPNAKNPKPINVLFNGTNGAGVRDSFVLNEKLLSQHLLLVGGIGSGKTNTFNHIMSSISPQLGPQDVMIVFDTKGDFYKEFYRSGDIVISNDATACGAMGVDYWNIINEVEDDEHLEENVMEIANALFAERLKSGNDPFFPNAAKDIVTAALYHFVKVRGNIKSNNKILSDFFKSVSQNDLLDLLSRYPQYEAMKSYIPLKAQEQALGVMAEIQQVMRSVLIGNFAKPGTLSIRNLVRKKGGKRIFIEYDIGVGSMLSPIYTLLFDLAIKEALCRKKSAGNVFFVVDEFKLLPNLKHIDDAVNFGNLQGFCFRYRR